MSERGKGTRKRFPRRAASSASTTSTSAAASSSNSSPFSTAAPLAKRAKTVEELAAAAANKKHGNRPKRAFAELSQAAGLAGPTLQAVVDQAARKARMKNGQRTSARADGDDQQRTYFRRGEQAGVRPMRRRRRTSVSSRICARSWTPSRSPLGSSRLFTRKERLGTTRRARSRTTCTSAATTPLGATRQ